MATNPIPFNPETLTIRQIKDAAETLRFVFEGLARLDAGEVEASNFLFHLRQQRDSLARQWAQ
jgi:hypothetical protein